MDGYLTTDEIAQRLDVKVETVRRWVRQGKLPGLPLGRAGYRIRQKDFDAFVQGQEPQHVLSNSTAPSNNSNGISESHIEAAATMILERMTDGVLLFGLNGRCQYTNRQAEQLLGLTPDDLTGKTIDQVLPRNIADAEMRVRQDDYFSIATGRWYQVGIFSTPQGQCVSFFDITKHKQLEEQLYQREQQFATLVEHLPDVIFRLDKQLRHIYISPAIEHITGVASKNWIGKTGREMGLPSDICDIFEALCQEAIATGKEQHMEFFHQGRWQRSRIFVELASNGSVHFLTGITEDITERKYRQLNATFLSDLTTEFSRLSSQKEILQIAGMRMRQYFNVSSLTCAIVNEAANEFTVVYDSNQQNPISVLPQRLSDYVNGNFLREIKAGQVIVVNDVAVDPRTAAYPESFPPYPVRAFVLASCVDNNGQVNFVLVMQHSEPYIWRSDEINLMRELTVRIYPQLERVRAEQALRESEERYRSLFEAIAQGVELCELVRDEKQAVIDISILQVNATGEIDGILYY